MAKEEAEILTTGFIVSDLADLDDLFLLEFCLLLESLGGVVCFELTFELLPMLASADL